MELSPQHEERQGRTLTLGARIANFLNRSRSRSRKRRSRSLDAALTHDPMPTEGPSSSKHKRHSSLDPDGGYPAAASSSSRPATRSPSRPLSPTTKPKRSHKALAPHSSGAQTTGPVDIRTEVVILEQASPNSSRKGKKMNFFGLTLSSPRMSSFGDSSKSKSRSPTPGSQPGGKKGRSVLTRPSSAGVPSKTPESKRPIKGDTLDQGRPASPPAQNIPPRSMTTSPRYNGHYEEVQDDVDSEALQGRCSPLCGLGPSSAARSKGKEKERLGDWEQYEEKEVRHGMALTESQRGKGHVTNPRKVVIHPRELEKECRPLGVTSMERVASGSGTSRNSRGREGATSLLPSNAQANIKAKRIKHGSFDFERPVSAEHTRTLPSANLGGKHIAGPHALHRSSSSRNPPRRVTLDDSRPDRHAPLSSSLPKARPKPILDIDTHNLGLTRRTTDSSTATSRGQTSAIPRSSGSKAHHASETDPGSPISSTHSGNSSALNSSWGKSAGKRVARTAHPAFKFEPAVPTIPGSPAGSDERKRSIASSGTATPTPSSPLSKSRQALLAMRFACSICCYSI
ncbi:hypothetical protein DAEQUDRAFT_590960 [Daedalea quercina L-15889]|uniref:Uncharacterized protein n=1 Tax=Daedalea quercina L-15889 TaxID=1314783 RepID=A0A165SVZ3_9APHY|nr:hypothetical protein DAEQUDRAFT_590960 [Daedalea quercina L-15889]